MNPLKYTVLCISFCSVLTVCSAEQLTVRLSNGATLSGDFTRQLGGLFHKTASGGSQIPWRQLDPHALPKDLRQSLQNRLKGELARADQLYNNQQVLEAAPIYAKVIQHRSYLDLHTQTSPIFKDVHRKAQGLIIHDGKWISFSKRQQSLGLVQDRGLWIPREIAQINAKFDAAQKQARLRKGHEQSMLELLTLIRNYPQSTRVPEAEALVTRIGNWLRTKKAREQQEEQAQKAQVAQAPAPVRVIERVIEREPIVTHSGWNPTYYGGGFGGVSYYGGYNGYANDFSGHKHNHGHHGNRDRNRSQETTLQPGYTFKSTPNRFNTGYPFTPPVSVQLTGQRTPTRTGHSVRRVNHRHHNNIHQRTPGVHVHGQVGNVGVHVYRKDPIKIRF